MTKRIVVLDGGYEDYDAEESILRNAGATLEHFMGGRHDTAGKLAFAEGAIGAFVRWTPFDGAAYDAAPSLRHLVRYGVGYDNLDIPAASQRGVMLCNVQGYANQSVSDHALALILACIRNLRQGSEQLRSHYGAPPRPHMPDLKDMTLGIVGLGRIGGTLCTKARGLFKRVLACDPYVDQRRFDFLGAERMALDDILAQSDVVSIHCNLSDETRNMFDAAALAKMHPTAILINTARGPVVDEDALLEALTADRLYAAGLDVYCDEPPLENRAALLAHPHVQATGHYAWYSNDAAKQLQRRAAENMAAMLRGEIPDDCLNPEAFA